MFYIKRIKSLVYFLAILLSLLFLLPGSSLASDSLDSVKVSFHFSEGDSSYEYIRMSVYGNGIVKCTASRQGEEISVDSVLSKQTVKDLVSLFRSPEFTGITQEQVNSMEAPSSNAGIKTLTIEDLRTSSEISFTEVNNDALNCIATLCWKIFNQSITLHDLRNGIRTGSSLQDVLSSLQSNVREDKLIDMKEFMPFLISIVEDETLRNTSGFFAIGAISEITGMDIPWMKKEPTIANLVLTWWEANRKKNRHEWLRENMKRGEWKASIYLARNGDKSSIPYLLKALNSHKSQARRDSYIALCEITGREVDEDRLRFWSYVRAEEEIKNEIAKWSSWLGEKNLLNNKS